MSAANLLARVRAADIHLEAQGDRLVVDAPKGAVTPGLRTELTRHKPALLALLAPSRAFVTLRNGPTLPVEVVELAIDLEQRGFALSLDACHQIVIEPKAQLSNLDRSRIRRWRAHLGAVLAYHPEEVPM